MHGRSRSTTDERFSWRCSRARKRPVWIPEMYWEQMMKNWESLEYKAFSELNKRNRNEGRRGRGAGKYTASGFNGEVLQEQTRGGTPQEEAAATGILLPDDLQLMVTISGALDRSRLYGAPSKAAHLRAKNSWAAARLPPCCLEMEQRIMRRIEATVSSVCAAFDEHRRWFAEQSHLPYTLMPPMMNIVRAAMVVVPSTSSSMAVVAGTSDAARVSSSTPPPPSLMARAPAPLILPPPSSLLVMLEIPRIIDTCTFYALWMF
ncbi:hypothetical protein M9H77_21888 [Catharanthus roseus]|uniref:Uncharacterized protein n=1 Tax=Catharanthus roseus TaxID=4058 RepID=A0ACC0AQC7_CATRO|nr:hypothetical protein M9H77_21888 [Catharanthus roseus]